VGKILVGTASWTDPTLLQSGWYPDQVRSAEDRLRYYADRFPLVEVDSTFYALPARRNAQAWVERTPPHFRFDLKAFRAFTQHPIPKESLPRDLREALGVPPRASGWYYPELPEEVREELWRRFEDALFPLQQAGKLGVVLFQFPPWFTCLPAHREWVRQCVERLKNLSLAVEFRHKSWWEGRRIPETLAWEKELGVVGVTVDEPQGFASSVPAIWEPTSNRLALVRLHGRNRQTWMKKGLSSAAERFRYLYDDQELAELAAHIRRLSKQVEELHVIFNNCYRDYGVRNAARLREILQKLEENSREGNSSIL
jgi:uncharacterized protein YecE (DUF72 family)